jgi:hypothetical protein
LRQQIRLQNHSQPQLRVSGIVSDPGLEQWRVEGSWKFWSSDWKTCWIKPRKWIEASEFSAFHGVDGGPTGTFGG